MAAHRAIGIREQAEVQILPLRLSDAGQRLEDSAEDNHQVSTCSARRD
jgi:hypothetical protein